MDGKGNFHVSVGNAVHVCGQKHRSPALSFEARRMEELFRDIFPA